MSELRPQYDRDGFVIVPRALTAEEVAALRHETAEICRGHRGAVQGMSPEADEPDDDKVAERYLCIHFPHKISTAMRSSLDHPAAVAGLTELIGPNVKCMQSMLFVKACGQARPGLAPGRILHPHARPLADRRLDRPRRRHHRKRLPVGDPRLAQAGHALARPPAAGPTRLTAPTRRSVSRTATRTPSRSR